MLLFLRRPLLHACARNRRLSRRLLLLQHQLPLLHLLEHFLWSFHSRLVWRVRLLLGFRCCLICIFVGVLFRDDEDGDLSYNFTMAILDIDLE